MGLILPRLKDMINCVFTVVYKEAKFLSTLCSFTVVSLFSLLSLFVPALSLCSCSLSALLSLALSLNSSLYLPALFLLSLSLSIINKIDVIVELVLALKITGWIYFPPIKYWTLVLTDSDLLSLVMLVGQCICVNISEESEWTNGCLSSV